MDDKLIQCPNCGATLNPSELKGLKCPYCGSIVKAIGKQSKADKTVSQKIEFIIPFTITEEQAKQKLAKEMVFDEDIPVEVFDGLSIRVTKKEFIPVWWFEVSFKSPWSCQKVVYRREEHVRDGETYYETVRDYYPANGTAVGNFPISVAASRGENFYSIISEKRLLPFSQELIGDATVLEFDVDKAKAWDNPQIRSHVEYKSGDELRKQLPSSYTDFNSYYEYNYRKAVSALLPVWVLEFDYDGITYKNEIDGCYGTLLNSLDAPLNVSEEDNESEEDKSKDYKVGGELDGEVFNFLFWGFIPFLIGWIIAVVSSARNLDVPFPIIVAGLITFAWISFAKDLSLRDDKQKKMRNDLQKKKEKDKRINRNNRLRMLLNKPLLQPCRKEIEEAIGEESEHEYVSLEEYAIKVKKDRARKRLYKIILICLTLLSVASIPVSLIYNSIEQQKEQERQRIEQLKERQEAENRQRREAANLKAQQDKVYKVLSVANIFYSSREEYGHLRQDIREKLLECGFVKEKMVVVDESEEFAYHYESNSLATIYLNNKDYLHTNDKDVIRHLEISLRNDNFGNAFAKNFEKQLRGNGFNDVEKVKEKKNLTDDGNNYMSIHTNLPPTPEPSTFTDDHTILLIRTGKEITDVKQSAYDSRYTRKEYIANWDAVSIKKGEYGVSIDCYSKQGVDETADNTAVDSAAASPSYNTLVE